MFTLFVPLLFLAIFFLVVAVINSNAQQRSLVVPCIFGVFIIGLFIIGSRVKLEADLDWNPSIQDDDVVSGTWKGRDQTIVLKSDHTFSYRMSSQIADGTWTRDDWNLHLYGDHFSGAMRFVKLRGHYRLMTHPTDDPDAWNGDVGLEQDR